MLVLRRNIVAVICIAVLCVLAAFAVTQDANAQAANAAAGANAQCAAACAADDAIANSTNPPQPQLKCIGHGGAKPEPCQYAGPGGSVQGMCLVGDVCQATSASKLGGGSGSPDAGLSQLMQALGQLASQLAKAAAGGGGSGSGSSPAATTPTTGCVTGYYQTSNTSLIGIDPCAEYVPSSASQITTGTTGTTNTSASDLLNALSGNGSTSAASTPALSATPQSGNPPLTVTFSTNAIDSTQSYTINFGDGSTPQAVSSGSCNSSLFAACTYGTNYTYNSVGTYTANLLSSGGNTLASVQVTVANGSSAAIQQAPSLVSQSTTSQGSLTQLFSNGSGVSGNIFLTNTGATIFAQTINAGNNSAVSGFYGADTTFSTQPTGLVANLCQGRPWASNFLSLIIPPSFFDGLCQWQGYQVGMPPPAAATQVTLQQQTVQQPAAQPAAATSTPAGPYVASVVQIWAVPAAVPLGARTSIFWNTQGVNNCTETSPDGSFSQSTLSGAAATVPLTAATTFTISCLNASSTPVTGYVTVNISI